MTDPIYCPVSGKFCTCPYSERCDRYDREPAEWTTRHPAEKHIVNGYDHSTFARDEARLAAEDVEIGGRDEG